MWPLCSEAVLVLTVQVVFVVVPGLGIALLAVGLVQVLILVHGSLVLQLLLLQLLLLLSEELLVLVYRRLVVRSGDRLLLLG